MENTNENMLEMLQEKRTSSEKNFIIKHKFIMMVISVFVCFSILNIALIYNFIDLLKKVKI